MAEQSITRANYDVVALTEYLKEQCPGTEKYSFVFVKPRDSSAKPEYLTCPIASLFQILMEKQGSGLMLYVQIAEGIYCAPAGIPDVRLDPPPTIAAADARTIAILSKDTRASEWNPPTKGDVATSNGADSSKPKRGRPRKDGATGGGGGGGRSSGAQVIAEDADLTPPLGAEHRAMLLRRGWTETMILSSGLGTITDVSVLAAFSPRGATASPYALAIPYALDESGAPKGRRVQLEVPDMGDSTALAKASVWDRATLGPYIPAPVAKDGRLKAADDCPDPLVIVFDELDAHVLAEIGQRAFGVERLEALRVRTEGAESLHPSVRDHANIAGADVVIVGYPAVPGRRLLEARRAGKWLFDAGARRVRFVGTSQGKLSECVADPAYWDVLVGKAVALDKDVCGEPYTTLRDALPPDIAADPVFVDALNLYVPEGYDVDPLDGAIHVTRAAGYANGVEIPKQVLISRSPIVPVARVVTAKLYLPNGGDEVSEESTESCIIAHRRETGWALLHVPMRSLSTKQGIVSLREYGIAATEQNAVELIGWFHHMLEINTLHGKMQTLPRFTALGWHTLLDGTKVFAMPRVTPGQYSAAPALVTASGPALEGYGARGGTREGQYRVLRLAAKHPTLRFAILEVFRSMLVPLLGGNRSRCMHFFNTTTSGKTLGMYIVMNIYGRAQQIEIKGSSTMTGLERQMAARNHSTIYVDDIMHKPAEEREAMLYMASDGQGKTRATKDAEIRKSTRWVAGMITTGEKPLQDHGMAQGAQARAFELEYVPFDPELVNALMDGVQHYGHVIHDFLGMTDQILALAPKYTATLRELTVALRQEALDRGENSRTSDHMAEVLTVYLFLDELGLRAELGLPNDNGAEVKALLYSDGHMQTTVLPEHTDAFEALQSFMLANRHQIVGVNDPSPRQNVVARIDGEHLLVEKRWLTKFLQKEGYNSRNVLRKWQLELVAGKTQRRTADGRPKFYHFKLSDVLGTQADQQPGYDPLQN